MLFLISLQNVQILHIFVETYCCYGGISILWLPVPGGGGGGGGPLLPIGGGGGGGAGGGGAGATIGGVYLGRSLMSTFSCLSFSSNCSHRVFSSSV